MKNKGHDVPSRNGQPNLRIPPVALVLICGATMWVLSALYPAAAFPLPGAPISAVAFAAIGGGIAVAGVFAFRRSGTTVNPLTPDAAKSVVKDGIYRFTRNPMYLGLALILAGWGIYLANIVALIILPAFVVFITQFQIKAEERGLLARFGADYADYMASVRRWL